MINYSIKDLEKLTGIKAHTIRIWEKRYNVVCPVRTDTNIRLYSDSDLKRLLNVSILNRNGLKISSILQLSSQELNQKVLDISNSSINVDSVIESMIIAMIDLDEAKFEKLLSNGILKYGFEETITNIIYPFLEKIGVLWLIGTIYPAQEHFISNLIRQKLIIALDTQVNNSNTNRKSFLMFLRDGEYHEISLLYYSFLIKRKGHRVIYLGQNTPLADLVQLKSIINPDFVVTSFTTSQPQKELNRFISELAENFDQSMILIGGNQINEISIAPISNVILMEKKADLDQVLADLK
ncbi:MAG: MerR family transcriptional regulator [Bacteroidetes bacterium]|nr:MerR family transcriptional regulator [Bacteroidota bacterium]